MNTSHDTFAQNPFDADALRSAFDASIPFESHEMHSASEELPSMEELLMPPSFAQQPTPVPTGAHPESFYLERLVHHLLKSERRTGWERALVDEMTRAGMDRLQIMDHVVWPTMECLLQLRGDEMLGERRLNTALRLLRTMAEEVIGGLPAVDGGESSRSVMVFAAPGERYELGAHTLSQLAERCGWRTYFAGANLTTQEILFAVGQLEPDVLLIHATQCRCRAGLWRLLKDLQKSRVWPVRQIAVCGTAAGQPDADQDGKHHAAGGNASRTRRHSYDMPADLMATGPVEMMELLALTPDYRRPREAGESLQLGNPFLQATMPGVTDNAAIREMMARYLGRELGHEN